MMNIFNLPKSFLTIATLGLLSLAMNSCVPLAVGAAGAAGGYILNEKGYKVQNPITKKEQPYNETHPHTDQGLHY